MTTIDPSPDAAAAPDQAGVGRLLDTIVDWLTSTDHKKIGRLYLSGGVLGLLATIVVNVVLGIERTDGDSIVTDGDALAQLIDAQRLGLVFGTMLPLTVGLCVAVVPLQLGARALAFPRLAGLGLWLWFGGLVLSIVALARDGGTLGADSDMVDLFIAAIGLMAAGALSAAVSVGTTVLTTRAPGMTMRRVPFFSWSALIYALTLVLVMPVLVGTMAYLFVDHRYARDAFGGNEGILEWAGWILTQPATFVFAIPVFGVFAELLPITFAKRAPGRGIVFAGLALVGVAALAAVTQIGTFNMPWAGSGLTIDDGNDFEEKLRDFLPFAFFNLLPVLGALMVIGLGLAMAKPQKGAPRPRITAAFVFALFAALLVLLGMVASVLHAIDDLALQGTVFEEGVVMALVYGVALGAMAGILHWSPKLSGRVTSTAMAIPVALLGAAGAALASIPYFVAGFLDQPGLYVAGGLYDDSDLTIWNVLVLIGHGLMGLTVLAFIALVLKPSGDDRERDETTTDDAGDDTDADPWGGQTLEWITFSPAPDDNFDDVPVVESAEPALDLQAAETAGGDS